MSTLSKRLSRLEGNRPADDAMNRLLASLSNGQLNAMVSLCEKMQAWQEGGDEPELTEQEWKLLPLLENAQLGGYSGAAHEITQRGSN